MRRGPVIPMSHANQSGVTLVELVAFIVIVALLATGLIAAFTSAMRDTPKSNEITQALQLAQERMELVLAQKQRLGFTGFTPTTYDPCPPVGTSTAAICTPVATNYGVTSSLLTSWNGSTEFKVITVNVTGPQMIALTALVASY